MIYLVFNPNLHSLPINLPFAATACHPQQLASSSSSLQDPEVASCCLRPPASARKLQHQLASLQARPVAAAASRLQWLASCRTRPCLSLCPGPRGDLPTKSLQNWFNLAKSEFCMLMRDSQNLFYVAYVCATVFSIKSCLTPNRAHSGQRKYTRPPQKTKYTKVS